MTVPTMTQDREDDDDDDDHRITLPIGRLTSCAAACRGLALHAVGDPTRGVGGDAGGVEREP